MPLSGYPLDVYGIEVGNSQSFQGTYLTGEAQVQNPGFEQGTSGWFMGQTMGTVCTFTIDSDAYEGSQAANLTVENDGYCMLGNSTPIPINQTGTYRFSSYAKVSGDVDHLSFAIWKSEDPNETPNTIVGYINPNTFSGD